MIAVLATAWMIATTAPTAVESLAQAPEAFAETASAQEIVETCRKMLPTDFEIEGHVNRRSRHGTEIAAYRYRLERRNGNTDLVFTDKQGQMVPFEREGRLLDTDITWSDLTLDFLWWDEVGFDAEAEAKSFTGILCKVLRLKQGKRMFRVWIDRRTGAMIQAQEVRLVDGELKTLREVFCTSLKKFDDRWAPRNIEVGPPGARYRTKIVIEKVR